MSIFGAIIICFIVIYFAHEWDFPRRLFYHGLECSGNIGGGCELDVETVVKKILNILGKSHDLIGVSNARPGVDKRYAMSYTKLYNKTGWKPIMNFDVGLQHTIDWYLNR